MLYPALDVHHDDHDLVLALVDDCSPTAAEEHAGFLTIFFPDRHRRDRARAAIASACPHAVATPREVDDEDWAKRSQENLRPTTIGRITVFPASRPSVPGARGSIPDSRSSIAIVIEPSMGFGTGHHATTRLCLRALQTTDLGGALVLDVGTGSGVLAIAARLLGAASAVGIDHDPDAVQAARANLAVNPLVDFVHFEEADLASFLPSSNLGPSTLERKRADVVTANLTGALLVREAVSLCAALAPGGSLLVSGLLAGERDEVAAAFERASELRVVWEAEEDGWVGLVLRASL